MSRVPTSFAALVAALVLTSCSSGTTDDAAPRDRDASPTRPAAATSPPLAAPPDPDSTVRPTWRRKLSLLTQPVVVGTTAVVVVRAGRDEMALVGVGVDDGAVRWRHPYSPGRTATGYGLSVHVADADGRRRVVFQRPDPERPLSWYAPIVAIRPDTGRVTSRSRVVTVDVPLAECDDGVGVCTYVVSPSGRQRSRFDPATGEIEELDDLAGGVRSLGAGLVDDGRRPDDGIARVVDGKVRWRQPLARLFGDDYSSDFGWDFRLDRPSRTYWGTVGWRPPLGLNKITFRGKTGARTSIRIRQLVGFSARTGRRIWHLGQVLPVSECQADVPATVTDVAVACWFRGDIDVRSGRRWLIDDIGLLGFDPATGKVRWRVSAGRGDLLDFVPPDRPAVTGADGFLRTADGALIVDYDDGSTTRLPGDAVLLCAGPDNAIGYALDSGAFERGGDAMLAPCGPDGSPRRRTTHRSVELAGVEAPGGWHLIGSRDGLAAYRF